MEFPCSQCGACCSNAKLLEGVVELREDGSCVHFENQKCSIYESRPLLCNVGRAYKSVFKPMYPGITQKDFFKLNSTKCNEMIEEQKIDPSFLIDMAKEYGGE